MENVLTKSVLDIGSSGKPTHEASGDARLSDFSEATEDSDSADESRLGSGALALMENVLTKSVLDLGSSGKPTHEASGDARLSDFSEATEDSDSADESRLGSGALA